MSTERVFFVGGTGSIGAIAVKKLLEKNIAVTLYARNPEKALETFHHNSLINVVQGDYSDLTPLKAGIAGHSRLFLLISDLANFVRLKKEIAEAAYAAGVRQVVDISSFTVNRAWRSSYIATVHYEAERTIYNIPNRGKFVALRPSRFMSNCHTFDLPTADGKIFDTADPHHPQSWVSANDIGEVAAVVLSDPVAKHQDMVYAIDSDVVTGLQRAEILSRITGREITYVQLDPVTKYNQIMKLGHFPHFIAYDLSCGGIDCDIAAVTAGIEVLLGRPLEKFEDYLIPFKDLL